jgi:hypothetical protein
MTRQAAVASVTALADRARQLTRQYPPRTPERRAAAAVYVALTTTRTTDAARRALGTFGDPSARTDAAALLSQIEQEITP